MSDVANSYVSHIKARGQNNDLAEMEQWAENFKSGVDSTAAAPSFEDVASGKYAPRRPTNDALGRLPAPKTSIASKIVDNVSEIPGGVARGVHDAVYNATAFVDPLADWLDENVANLGSYKLDGPDTITGNLTKSITQFLTGFVPAMKGLKALGMTNKIATPVLASAISDFATRDPHEGRLADLWMQADLPKNVLTDYLASNKEDGVIEARFKNALESAGLGLATEGVFLGARAIKAARKTTKVKQAEEAHLKAVYGETSDEDIARIVGDPSKPAIETRIVQPPKIAGKIEKGMEETAKIEPSAMVRKIPKAKKVAAQNVETFYHAGEYTSGDVNPGTFFNSDKEAVEQFAKRGGGAKVSEFQLYSKKSATEDDVINAAKKEGIFSEDVPAGQYLERDIYDESANIIKSLRDSGFDSVKLDDGLSKSPSLVVLDPGIAKPITDVKAVDPNFPKTGLKSDDFETYVNFARIDTPEQVKFTIGKLAEGLKGSVDEARRGKITQEQTAKMADDLGMTVADLLQRRKGQGFNAEEALAARQLWTASGETLLELAKKASAANAGPLDQFAFRKAMAVHSAIQNEVIGARTETARALASWAIPAGGKIEKARAIDQVLQTMGGPEQSKEMARKLAILAESGASPAAIARFVQRGWGSKSMDAVKEVWVNGLLSTLKTHVVNMLSNSLVSAQSVYERAAAAGISKLTGSEGVQFGEATAMAFGMVQSVKEAWVMAAKALKTGETGWSFNKVDITHPNSISTEAFNMAKGTTAGRFVDFLGHATNVPGRLLGAEDEFFKTINYRAEVNAQALRQAKSEGLSGVDLKNRITELTANPPEHIRINSADMAMYNTFTNELGKFGTAIMNLRNVDSPLNPLPFILPFVRTPANITRYTFERTPLAPLVGQWRADIAAGGARADLALAKMSTGTAIMMTAMDYASDGLISGSGPTGDDKTVRESLLRSGWQPYSVKVGDRWVSYNRADPFGTTIGLAASITEAIQKGEIDEDDVDEWQEVMAMSIAAISEVTINKTYLEGFASFVETMGDPKRYSERYVDDLIASFIPMTSLMNSVKNLDDPIQREASSPAEAIQARIIGLSKNLPPRRDLWGEPITNESGLGRVYDAFSPASSRKQDVDPVDREIARLNGGPERIKKRTSFDGVNVSFKKYPKVYDEYVRLAGNDLKHPGWGLGAKDFLNAVISGKHPMSAVYGIMSDPVRKDFIISTVSDYRKLAQRQIIDDPKNAAFVKEVEAIKSLKRQSRMPVL